MVRVPCDRFLKRYGGTRAESFVFTQANLFFGVRLPFFRRNHEIDYLSSTTLLLYLYTSFIISSVSAVVVSQEFAEANWDESAEDQDDLQQWQVSSGVYVRRLTRSIVFTSCCSISLLQL